jgi:predicted O-methyltransferase YrrM
MSSSINRSWTGASHESTLADEETFRDRFLDNLRRCEWKPHPLYNVFTQYDQDYYLGRKDAFLYKYRCFYAVSKTIAPRRIIELGVAAGSSADAYLSASPEAEYIGLDLFSKHVHRDHGSTWDPYVIAQKLFADRGFKKCRLMRANLRTLDRLPATADLVVVDAAHDYENEYADLRLSLTANPTFIFVDDAGDERAAKPAIKHFLETDLRRRLAYTVPIDYSDGGLVIKLRESRPPETTSILIDEDLRTIPVERSSGPSGGSAPGGVSEDDAPSENDAERRALNLIERGTDVTAPTRFGPAGRLMRRLVLFLLRPYDRHQREVHRAILDVVKGRHDQGGSASQEGDAR